MNGRMHTDTGFSLAEGVWPTMITPFAEDGTIDYAAVDQLVEWYIAQRVDGIFAVCQSSEMFYLDSAERTELSRRVVGRVDGRCGVIASGHVADGPDEQLRDVESIAATGVDAVVLVANRFAEAHEPDGLWLERTLEFVERVGTGIRLGLYECPYPYKRLVSIDNLVEIASSGRFHFLKDTSCVTQVLEDRARALEGSRLQLYNAHSATLVESLRCGYAGFSGVMANFHPDLYSWLIANYETSPHCAEVRDVLGLMSLAETLLYPVGAKYHLTLSGVEMSLYSRAHDSRNFDEAMRLNVEQLFRVAERPRRGVVARA